MRADSCTRFTSVMTILIWLAENAKPTMGAKPSATRSWPANGVTFISTAPSTRPIASLRKASSAARCDSLCCGRFGFGARCMSGSMSDRSVHSVGVLPYGSKRWVGGLIYTHNLIRALRSLPDDERPDLRLLLTPKNSVRDHLDLK